MPPIYFHGNSNKYREHTNTFFSTTKLNIGYAFSRAGYQSLCSSPLFGLSKRLEGIGEFQQLRFFSFAFWALLCHTPFCQTAAIILLVTKHKNNNGLLIRRFNNLLILPTLISYVMNKNNEICDITFGETLGYIRCVVKLMDGPERNPVKIRSLNRSKNTCALLITSLYRYTDNRIK